MEGLRLWVSGYRSWELNVYGDQDPKLTVIKYALKSQLQSFLDVGMNWVITGGELGIEQWAIDTALTLKPANPSLRVAMMLPYQEFGHQWNEANQAQLATRQTKVDFAGLTSHAPYNNPRQLSGYNRFMAQHTDAALFIYDLDFPGKPAFAYEAAKAEAARRADYELRLVSMDDLEEAAREYGETQNDHFQS